MGLIDLNHLQIQKSCDILIIGGGPSGSAAASMLARAGRRVMLADKDRFPRDKLCGEFLSGEALPLLHRLGCGAAIEAAQPARITRWRFTAPSGREIEGCLPIPAAGLSRCSLDEILFRHAAASGAAAREAAPVKRLEISNDGAINATIQTGADDWSIRSALIIAAWGRHPGPLISQAPKRQSRPAPYIGVKRHHEIRDGAAGRATREALDECVEIHIIPGGYCGLSFIEGGRINMCMLLEADFVIRHNVRPAEWGRLIEILAGANRALALRLDGLQPADDAPPLIVAQPAFGRRDLARGPILQLGDAAGMIPPLCGDGQAMALCGAFELCGLMNAFPAELSPRDISALGREWAGIWNSRYARRIDVGRSLQWAMGRPWLAEAGVRLLGFMPWAAAGLVQATRGRAET